MSTRETSPEDHPNGPVEGGVLAALPRTRPQTTSPRRAAARQRAGKAKSETEDSPRKQSTPKATAPPKNARKATAARQATRKATPAKLNSKAAKAKASPVKTSPVKTASSKATSIRKPAEPHAPKQGYEPEEEVELGKTVDPPSGVELVESVADIFGELAGSSLAAGGRILKDAFSLLRRP